MGSWRRSSSTRTRNRRKESDNTASSAGVTNVYDEGDNSNIFRDTVFPESHNNALTKQLLHEHHIVCHVNETRENDILMDDPNEFVSWDGEWYDEDTGENLRHEDVKNGMERKLKMIGNEGGLPLERRLGISKICGVFPGLARIEGVGCRKGWGCIAGLRAVFRGMIIRRRSSFMLFFFCF